jgi:hypothetical protein
VTSRHYLDERDAQAFRVHDSRTFFPPATMLDELPEVDGFNNGMGAALTGSQHVPNTRHDVADSGTIHAEHAIQRRMGTTLSRNAVMSATRESESVELPPPQPVRWFRPYISTAHLELLSTPVLAQTAESDKWVALTESESDACERIWQSMSQEEKDAALKYGSSNEPGPEKEGGEIAQDREILPSTEPSEVGVPVGKERLFEIDVKHLMVG